LATESKPATADTLEREELFRRLVESVRDYAIFMLDPTGHVSTWNVGAQRIKGYTAAEIIGRHFSTFYPEDDVAAGKCEFELLEARRIGRFEDEGWRVRKDGTRFWANVIISAMRDDAGGLLGFSKVTRDLTERRRAEEERAARLAAEQANRAKDEFLAMLGHELRNPLSPILTAVQLMKLRGDGKPTRELEVIERQAKHMITLVDDLLDVSRITRGKLELKRRRIDMRSVLAKAIEIASPLLEQRLHHLELDAPARPITVDGDEARLTQAVANVVVNAAKYTDPGGRIRIALRATGPEVEVEVTDNGAGIEPALLPRIFHLFVQGEQSAERSVGGLGLGLALVKTLVGLHGGSVEAHSAGLGTGSTFTIRLPLAEIPALETGPATAIAATPGATRRRILIVDDNEDALILLAEALAAAGHEITTAHDAPEALAKVREAVPEIAILDIGLPVMDGYELARRLRSELGSACPHLIALTGYGQPRDRARSEEAGFDAHLVKPVEVKTLMDRIAGVRRSGTS
jgi:PAS domain S-box-containing protein